MAEVRGKNNHLINDDEFYKNIKASSIEKGTLAQTHAEKMREEYGDNLQGHNVFDSFADKAYQKARGDVKAFKGAADANAKFKDEELKQVAEAGRVSQIQSMLGSIAGAGGVDALSKLSFESSEIKTATQSGSLQSQVTEALKEHFKKMGLSGKDLEKAVNDALKELGDGQVPQEALKQIVGKAFTLTGAKERSEYASIDAVGGSEKYKETIADQSAIDMAKTSGKVQEFMKLINNPDALNAALDKLSKHMNVSNLRGKTGFEFLKALGEAQALFFGGSNVIVGKDGKVFQGAITPDGDVGGTVKGGLNEIIDNSFTKKQGQKYEGQLRDDIHKGIKNFLSWLGVDPKTANDIADGVIAGWDEGKDIVEGLATAAAGYGMYKKGKDILHSRFPKNSSASNSPNLNAKNKPGIATKPATDHLTMSNSSTSHSFKDMGGLTGEPPSKFEVLKTKAENSIEKYAKKVKSLATELPGKALPILDKLAVPLTLADFAYKSNEWYHKFREDGDGVGYAFAKSGIMGVTDITKDTLDLVTFGQYSNFVNSSIEARKNAVPFDRSNVKAIADNPSLYNQTINTGHVTAHPISPIAAATLQQPTAGADYHTSVANQVQAIQLQQRLVQDQEYMRQFINPTNPAYGVTLQTASGELSLASTPRGTLEIGGYQTNVLFLEF